MLPPSSHGGGHGGHFFMGPASFSTAPSEDQMAWARSVLLSNEPPGEKPKEGLSASNPILESSAAKPRVAAKAKASTGRFWSWFSCGREPTDAEVEKMVKAAEVAVILNVYALGNAQVARTLQPATRNVLSAGALHVAVEVCGTEWSYGWSDMDEIGIFYHEPRKCAQHSFVQAIYLGDCKKTPQEICAILTKMKPEWPAKVYDIFSKSSWHFAMALVHKLGAGTLPSGLNRLGRQGPIADSAKAELRRTQQIPSEYRNSFHKGMAKLSGPLEPSLAGLDTEGIVDKFLQGMRRTAGTLQRFCGPNGRAEKHGCTVMSVEYCSEYYKNPIYNHLHEAMRAHFEEFASMAVRYFDVPEDCLYGHMTPASAAFMIQVLLSSICPTWDVAPSKLITYLGEACRSSQITPFCSGMNCRGFSYVWDYALSQNCKLLAADGDPAEDDESAGGSSVDKWMIELGRTPWGVAMLRLPAVLRVVFGAPCAPCGRRNVVRCGTPICELLKQLEHWSQQALENSDQLKHPDPDWRLPEALLEEVVLELSGRAAELSGVQKRDLCSYCSHLQLRLPKALQDALLQPPVSDTFAVELLCALCALQHRRADRWNLLRFHDASGASGAWSRSQLWKVVRHVALEVPLHHRHFHGQLLQKALSSASRPGDCISLGRYVLFLRSCGFDLQTMPLEQLHRLHEVLRLSRSSNVSSYGSVPVGRLADLRESMTSSTLEKDVLRVLRASRRRGLDGDREILLQQKVAHFFELDILIGGAKFMASVRCLMTKRLLPSTMALRLCYVSGEVLTELTLEEEDTVAKVKGLADEQLPLGTAVSALLLDKEKLQDTCIVKSLMERSEGLELVAVTGPQKPESYVTLDNGGTPFVVRILSRGSETTVTICVRRAHVDAEAASGETEELQEGIWLHEYDTSSPLMRDVPVERVFIGKSPLNAMTTFSGGHGPRFDGNSVLLKRENDYVFVGDEIFSFTAAAEIVDFVSPVGNSSVPYPYCVDADGRHYLMLEGVVLDEIPALETGGDPYSYWYDASADRCDFELLCNGAKVSLHGAAQWQRFQRQHPLARNDRTIFSEITGSTGEDIQLDRFLERVQSMLSIHGVSLLQRIETLCRRQ
eukprot:s2141_g10.t1